MESAIGKVLSIEDVKALKEKGAEFAVCML